MDCINGHPCLLAGCAQGQEFGGRRRLEVESLGRIQNNTVSRDQVRKMERAENDKDNQSEREIKYDAESLKEATKQRIRNPGGRLSSPREARPRQIE